MESKQLFLKPNEAKFISLAVLSMIEDVKISLQDDQLNWTPEVRKDLNEMKEAGISLKIKMKKLGFDMRDLQPCIDGEEKDYLTKES